MVDDVLGTPDPVRTHHASFWRRIWTPMTAWACRRCG